jgi:hypothetical protein
VRATCAAAATVRIGSKVHRAKLSRSVPAGKATTLRLRFSRSSARAIRAELRRKSVRASVTLTVTAPDGAKGTARRTVRLSR